jgi:hypothetical protein
MGFGMGRGANGKDQPGQTDDVWFEGHFQSRYFLIKKSTRKLTRSASLARVSIEDMTRRGGR